jgi:hypothetical protein
VGVSGLGLWKSQVWNSGCLRSGLWMLKVWNRGRLRSGTVSDSDLGL